MRNRKGRLGKRGGAHRPPGGPPASPPDDPNGPHTGNFVRLKDVLHKALGEMDAESRVPEEVVDQFMEKRLPALLERFNPRSEKNEAAGDDPPEDPPEEQG